MKKTFAVLMCMLMLPAFAASPELDAAIANVRTACGGISDAMVDLKRMAGINAAVTGVGTAIGVGATAVGIAKVGVDAEADEVEKELQEEIDRLNKLAQTQGYIDIIPVDTAPLVVASIETNTSVTNSATDSMRQKQEELTELTTKSKDLGNWRIGLLATNTATNIAGVAVAAGNQINEDLDSKIKSCVTAIANLSRVRMTAQIDESASDKQLKHAQDIITECSDWETVDLSAINKRARGAAAASGVGAGIGLAGTIVSVTANTEKVRDGDAEKENNLNTAANVMAGGATVASGAATIFNATQISAIKRAVETAEKCEGALE